MKKLLFFILTIYFLLPREVISRVFSPVKYHKAMVVAPEPHAADIGAEVLRRGGNAIDAAVAVAFTLAVTYPRAGNIGGGGFLLYRTSENNRCYALDYREKAPIAASRNMYLNENGEVIENASIRGYLAAGVPGTVAGLWKAHKRFGKLKWAELLAPAIDLAENGFLVDESLALSLRYASKELARYPSTRKIFLKESADSLYEEGEKLVQKDLAATLKRIAKNGPEGFYSGETAELIEREMRNHGGIISRKDLEEYEAVWRDPIEIEYRGHTIYSMPLPSSGGIVLAEILNGLENYDVKRLGHNSAAHIQLFTEICRFAYADRAQYLGDADFVDVPVQRLIRKSYMRNKVLSINWFKAGNSDSILSVNALTQESQHTTHFSIVDQWNNAVSNTYTLNDSYGSKVVIEGTGILLNDEMDDFSIKPGLPNMFGLLGNEANAIEPEKRMLSSMTPTIVTKNDSLFMVVGSPGGSRIITTVAQTISNVIDFNMNIRHAIEAPRFHHQWKPDVIFFENSGFSRDTKNMLLIKGYNLKTLSSIGIANGIRITGEEKKLTGWADPRGSGKVNGY